MNLMMLWQMMQGGGDPMTLLRTFAQQNPQAAPALQMVDGKDPDQLKTIYFNLCQSRGVDPAQFAQQMGVQLPK